VKSESISNRICSAGVRNRPSSRRCIRRDAVIFFGAGWFALSQALNFGLRLQRAVSLDARGKNPRAETSPTAPLPNPRLRAVVSVIPAMDAPSGTPPTPPYSIPPAAVASVAPPPYVPNPSGGADAGNTTAATRALFVPPRPTLHTSAAAAQAPGKSGRRRGGRCRRQNARPQPRAPETRRRRK
jgi:hypothetical protein